MNSVKSFDELMKRAREEAEGKPAPRIAVCAAEDESAVLALDEAQKKGLASAVLVGDREAIAGIMETHGLDQGAFVIHDVDGPVEEKAARSVELIRRGEADILMKGMVPTSAFLHPIFNRGNGLLTGNFVSHTGVLQVPGIGRLLIQTDGGINISPTVEEKKGIIINAVFVAHLLGVLRPRVALLSATEKVHPRIPSTVDARDLAAWAKEGVPDADVEGPLALDLAISDEAVRRKGIKGVVAGRADILVSPNIEMGNVVYKALRYFAHAEGAGIVVGAACPIILTSRSDPPKEKLNSLALAVLYQAHIREAGYRIRKA